MSDFKEMPIPVGAGFNPLEDMAPPPDDASEVIKRDFIEELQRRQDLFRMVFASPHGQEVLAILDEKVNLSFGYNPDAGFYNGAAYGFQRDGQKSMVDYIRAMIKEAEERN